VRGTAGFKVTDANQALNRPQAVGSLPELPGMTLRFSMYLDVVRFMAALAVLIAHLSLRPFTQANLLWRLGPYGDVAVVVFFVLSGYVIAYVVDQREKSAAEYFSARLARLYSVAGLSLILTFILDSLGQRIDPDLYTYKSFLWKSESWSGYLSSAVFLNEFQIFQFDGTSPGTNGPYWSLSFEATYYAVAGLFIYFKPRIWLPASLVILALAGKTIAALLPIWVLGFALYRWRPTLTAPRYVATACALASGLVLLLSPQMTAYLPSDNFGVWLAYGRGVLNRILLKDYLVAFVMAVHLVSVRSAMSKLPSKQVSERLVRTARYLGSLTFPLYCIHFPAICFLTAIYPWQRQTPYSIAFVVFGAFVLVIALTPVCDHLKVRIRNTLRSTGQPTLLKF
jgi:peptidoglycan/LPS O-acetylase OafA/YrhL